MLTAFSGVILSLSKDDGKRRFLSPEVILRLRLLAPLRMTEVLAGCGVTVMSFGERDASDPSTSSG